MLFSILSEAVRRLDLGSLSLDIPRGSSLGCSKPGAIGSRAVQS